MSFSEILKQVSWEEAKERIYGATEEDVRRALAKTHRDEHDFAALLSPAAESFIEPAAQASHTLTVQRFGRTIKIYGPLYVSNECTNHCTYCGFNHKNKIARITLTPDEIRREAEAVAKTGIRHILLVSGEHPKRIPLEYLLDAVKICNEYFAAVAIEVYPLSTEEYQLMTSTGVDGLTVYQETYNRDTYADVHPAGKKREFDWRLDAPERGAAAGMRSIGIGALMGLNDFRIEEYYVGLHARYLMKKFWKTHIMVSFPRIRHAEGGFKTPHIVSDLNLVQSITSLRLFLPDVGLVISTREGSGFREHLLPLGVTQMSAGAKTDPGGYTKPQKAGEQFAVQDGRTVDQFCSMLKEKGYDPVMKDWDRSFHI